MTHASRVRRSVQRLNLIGVFKPFTRVRSLAIFVRGSASAHCSSIWAALFLAASKRSLITPFGHTLATDRSLFFARAPLDLLAAAPDFYLLRSPHTYCQSHDD